MNEPSPDKLEQVRAAVRRAMERKGLKPKPLAKRAGLGETSVRDLIDNEGRDIRVGTLFKLSNALDTTIDEFIGSADRIQLSGRIGAGGSIIFEELAGETVPRPPGLGGALEALEVEGDSMFPRYSSQDVVFIARTHDGVDEADLGDFCAVRVVSGETYLKLLARGSRPGFFTLRSLNAPDIEDVELAWATPILFVLPRAARRRLGI